MIIFEFDYETRSANGCLKSRSIYWISDISFTYTDQEHEDEICEQLDAEQVFL
jgi:hypothetical protein